MSSTGHSRRLPEDLRIQRVIEVLLGCARGRFTGSIEVHFLQGRPMVVRKTEVDRFERPEGDAHAPE